MNFAVTCCSQCGHEIYVMAEISPAPSSVTGSVTGAMSCIKLSTWGQPYLTCPAQIGRELFLVCGEFWLILCDGPSEVWNGLAAVRNGWQWSVMVLVDLLHIRHSQWLFSIRHAGHIYHEYQITWLSDLLIQCIDQSELGFNLTHHPSLAKRAPMEASREYKDKLQLSCIWHSTYFLHSIENVGHDDLHPF